MIQGRLGHGAKTRAGVVLLFVFAVGFLSGIIFEQKSPVRRFVMMSPVEGHEAAWAELSEILDLDEDQNAQIHTILAKRKKVVQLKWEELRPELRNAIRQVHEDIAAVLRPDQRELFHDWLKKLKTQHESELLDRHRR